MENILKIGTARAQPGEKQWGRLYIREGKKSVRLAVAVLNGRRPGPRLVLIANQHGSEINGLAAVREFVRRVDPRIMRGSIIAFPCANPLAATQLKQSWLEEHERRSGRRKINEKPYSMNSNWPGRQGGTLVQRVIYEIWNQAIMTRHGRADFVLDIHSHQAPSAVYARTFFAADLGVVTGYRNIVVSGGGGAGTLGGECIRNRIMSLTLEPEGQMVFNPPAVDETVRALRNLAVFWKVLRGSLDLPPAALIVDPWKSQRLGIHDQRPSCFTHYARRAGLFFTRKRPYDRVVRNEMIGEILDPHSARALETIRTPMSGVLYMLHTGPAAVQKGDRMMTISVARKVAPRDYLRRKRLDCSRFMKEAVITAPSFAGKP